jgi:hypothetical protein
MSRYVFVIAVAFLVVIPAGNLLLVCTMAVLRGSRERKGHGLSHAPSGVALQNWCFADRQQIPCGNDNKKSKGNSFAFTVCRSAAS